MEKRNGEGRGGEIEGKLSRKAGEIERRGRRYTEQKIRERMVLYPYNIG